MLHFHRRTAPFFLVDIRSHCSEDQYNELSAIDALQQQEEKDNVDRRAVKAQRCDTTEGAEASREVSLEFTQLRKAIG